MEIKSKGGSDYPRFDWERALRRTELPKMPTTRNVLYALATFFSQDGVARVSVATLALASGLCPRAVKKHLRDAAKYGWVHVQRGAGVAPNTYRLNIPPSVAHGATGAPVHEVHDARGSSSGARGALDDARGTPLEVHPVHPNNTNTIHSPQRDKSSEGDIHDAVGQMKTETGHGLSTWERRSLMKLERQQERRIRDEASATEGRALAEQWAKELHIERQPDESDGEFAYRVLQVKQKTR